jgi:hypothetical protein
MTINKIYLYLILTATTAGGFGAGYIAAPAFPTLQDCMSALPRGPVMEKGHINNSQAKGR